MSNHVGAVALLMATLLGCAPISAQSGEGNDPHLRNDCRLAAQVLRTGHPAPRRAWALETIRRCEATGPEVLAAVWREAIPLDRPQLGLLFNVTRDFNDRRVVDAVADVARRREAPEMTRIYALALLFNYAVPGRYIDIQDLLTPGDLPPGIGYVTHDDRAHEASRLLGDLRPELSELLRSISGTEPNSRVGSVSTIILRRLADF